MKEILPFRANWENANEYPSPKFTEADESRYLHFAWEFVRRSPEYVKDLQKMLMLPDDAYKSARVDGENWCLDDTFCWPPAEPGETAKEYKSRLLGKVSRIYPPSNYFLSKWCLKERVLPTTNYSKRAVPFYFPMWYFLNEDTKLARKKPLLLPNEILIKFDVTHPIKSQLKIAQNQLEKLAESISEKSKKEGKNWIAPGKLRLRNLTLEGHFQLRCYDALTDPAARLTAKEVTAVLEDEYIEALEKYQEFLDDGSDIDETKSSSTDKDKKKKTKAFDAAGYKRSMIKAIDDKKFLRFLGEANPKHSSLLDFNSMIF